MELANELQDIEPRVGKSPWSDHEYGCGLGDPVRLATNPTIGGVPLPSRPAFVIGQAYAGIKDPEEYHRRRASFRLEA